MLGRSDRAEAMPVKLLSTQDGRTVLAITEQDDDAFGIMAAPVTLIAASAVTSPSMLKNFEGSLTFHPPVFQISIEAMDGPGCHQSAFLPVENLRTDSFLQSPVEFSTNDDIQGDSPFLASDRDSVSDHRSTTGFKDCIAPAETRESPRKGNPGRPKKKETGSFRCSVCQEEFSKQSLYRRHMENHAEEKPHRCPKCPASFNIPTNFTLHMATHNNGDPKCPECGRKFARMASLKSHMLLHEKEENLFCTECEDGFSTKTQLDAHLKLHGEKWSNEEARKCKLCNKQFIQPALYRLHIREHYRLQTRIVKQTKRGAKHKTMYKCTICLKSFQKPSQLMRHIRVHTGEKPFQCTICGRAFTQKSSLQIHTWQHNGIRPHTCDFCNAKFSQKGNLNAHIMRVHSAPEGEPIYGCTYCSCIFKKLGSLNGHIKRMHTNPGEMVSEMRKTNTATESDMQATVDSVITQLASLESAITSHSRISLEENSLMPAVKSDILQEALENSGLPSKNKLSSEGTSTPRGTVPGIETKKVEARTNFVTLLDKAPDGSTRKYLTIRQRCVENVRWYACSFCHKEFKKPSDLIRHLRVHTQEKPFKCTRCLRSFALKSTMLAHERTHVAAKRYNCEVCNKKFASQSSLTAHSRLHIDSIDHTPLPKLPSDRMGNVGKFPNVDTTVVHGTTKNQCKGKTSKITPEAEDIVSRVVMQEPLVITDSGNRICIAQGAHERIGAYLSSANGTHDITRPHKCWVCQAAFRKISHLKQHYRRHTGERPYKCSKCERRFTSNSVLKSHMHTHEDSRPYSCSACGSTFSTQSSMKRHLVTHSNKRPFMCPYCHKTFKTYVNCRKHMKIHRHELAQQQLEQEKAGELEATSNQQENFPLAEGIEITFQPQAHSEFSETFAQQERGIAVEKEKPSLPTNALISTVVNHKLLETGLGNVGAPQMLHADETGAVTLSSYCGEQSLTPESIREIEETLNQQLLNIGVNLTLRDNYSKEPYAGSSNITGSVKERSMLNVICDVNKGGIEASGGGNGSFPVNLDSFDMNQIALQTDGVLDIGINIGNSNSVASILPGIPKQIQQVSDLPAVSLVTGNESDCSDGTDKQRQGPIFGEAMLLISQSQRTSADPIESLPVKINMTAEQRHDDECSLVALENLHSGEVGPAEHSRSQLQETATDAEETNVVSNEDRPHAGGNISPRHESSLQCHICREEGFSTGDLKEHLKTHSGTKEYQCTECYLKFCTNGGLSRHSKIHVTEQEWNCATCCKAFTTKGQLRSHQKFIHEGKAKEVSLCEKLDSNKGTLASANVISSVKPSTDVLGIESDSSISEKILLDTVAEREGMNSLDDTVGTSERKEYTNKCKYCPKTFRKPSDLIRHIRTHTGEKPYRCEHCNKSFAVKCTLDSHTKVHTGKKTFRCHVCNSLFATKGSLKVHMRLHTGSKPFRCPVCDLRFRTSGHRKVHLLKHGKEKKESPKRKQRHLKVSAIAEVAAGLGQCDTSVTKVAQPGKLEHNASDSARNIEYTNLQDIGIDGTAFTTDQFTINTDGTISKNNSVLSVNDSNQLVANLHFLLANGLVTIHTEEPFLTQQSSGFDNQVVERNGSVLSVPAVEENGIDAKMSSIVVLSNAADNQNVSVLEQMAIIPTATTTTTTSPAFSTSTTTTMTTPTPTPTPMTADIIETCKRVERLPKAGAVKGNVSSVKMCDVCGKMFTKPYQVERHKRIHTGERPYKCDLCTKSFAQKSTLQMHQKHHTGDRPYPCPHCEYSFTQKGNLRTHVRRVHQIETKDSGKLQRTKPRQRSIYESKILNLDDMSFVELLK